MIDYYDALSSLADKTNSGYSVAGDENGDVITWYSDTVPQPTDAEVEAELAILLAREQQIEAIRASAMSKLVNKVGLTLEEVRTFLTIEGPPEEEE